MTKLYDIYKPKNNSIKSLVVDANQPIPPDIDVSKWHIWKCNQSVISEKAISEVNKKDYCIVGFEEDITVRGGQARW